MPVSIETTSCEAAGLFIFASMHLFYVLQMLPLVWDSSLHTRSEKYISVFNCLQDVSSERKAVIMSAHMIQA